MSSKTGLAAAAAAALALLLALAPAPAAADRSSFDCSMRELAISFAAARNPALSAAKLQQIADALDGTPEKPADCHVTVPAALLRERAALPRFGVFALPAEAPGATTLYVDYANGSDANAGTQAAPLKTVAAALAATRAAGGGAGSSIVLRAGTHFLAAQLDLTAADSGLTVQAFPGEEAWLSRGTPLTNVVWKAAPAPGANGTWVGPIAGQNAVYGGTGAWPTVVNSTQSSAAACAAACLANFTAGGPCTIYTWHDQNQGSFALQCWFRLDGAYNPTPEDGHFSGYFTGRAPVPNAYTADLSALGLSSVAGLRDFSNGAGGKRMIRARYPNADPEIQGFGSGLRASSWVAPTGNLNPAIQIRPATPYRPYGDEFQYFQAGSGGVCAGDFAGPGRSLGFTPPVGYWCGNQSEGGGAFTWRSPTGMTASSSVLPHQPYANGNGMVIQAWHPEHWASRMYLIGPGDYSYDAGSKTGSMTFLAGGFQDARGSNDAGEFYVENVAEELDAPAEWYYDEATQTLTFAYNQTQVPPTPNTRRPARAVPMHPPQTNPVALTRASIDRVTRTPPNPKPRTEAPRLRTARSWPSPATPSPSSTSPRPCPCRPPASRSRGSASAMRRTRT